MKKEKTDVMNHVDAVEQRFQLIPDAENLNRKANQNGKRNAPGRADQRDKS
jgi:hypothetical protein